MSSFEMSRELDKYLAGLLERLDLEDLRADVRRHPRKLQRRRRRDAWTPPLLLRPARELESSTPVVKPMRADIGKRSTIVSSAAAILFSSTASRKRDDDGPTPRSACALCGDLLPSCMDPPTGNPPKALSPARRRTRRRGLFSAEARRWRPACAA
jgi:hypothetical protein